MPITLRQLRCQRGVRGPGPTISLPPGRPGVLNSTLAMCPLKLSLAPYLLDSGASAELRPWLQSSLFRLINRDYSSQFGSSKIQPSALVINRAFVPWSNYPCSTWHIIDLVYEKWGPKFGGTWGTWPLYSPYKHHWHSISHCVRGGSSQEHR